MLIYQTIVSNIALILFRIWEWIVNLGRVDLLNIDVNELYTSYIVCAEHFERHYFLNERRRKLVYNAVPTIFNHYSHDVDDVSFVLESLDRYSYSK
jgi:hypothetical protein